MAKTKRFRPGKAKPPKQQVEFPREPIPPRRPQQPSLLPIIDGLSTAACDEMEAEMEAFKIVHEKVKAGKDELTKELDAATSKLIDVFVKHGQRSISVNGLSGEIVIAPKVKVKGTRKLRSEQGEDRKPVGERLPTGSDADFKVHVGEGLSEMGVSLKRL